MAKRRTRELLLTLLAVVACDAMPAEAEWNIDFHGGAAWISRPTSTCTVRTAPERPSP